MAECTYFHIHKKYLNGFHLLLDRLVRIYTITDKFSIDEFYFVHYPSIFRYIHFKRDFCMIQMFK